MILIAASISSMVKLRFRCSCSGRVSVLRRLELSLRTSLWNCLLVLVYVPFFTNYFAMSFGEIGHNFLAEALPVSLLIDIHAFLEEWVKSILVTASIHRS